MATQEDKTKAKQAIRLYSHILKVEKEKEETKAAKQEDKAYKKDFWKTAKDVTNGTFGKQQPTPTFKKSTADSHYKEKYEKTAEIEIEKLDWFPDINEPTINYNLAPYTPKDVKHTISKKNLNSAPGYDDIVYEYILKLPFLHQVLATIFTRIRDEGVAPDSWASSKIILIKKVFDEPNNDPSNFRMISLTLNIGKLYHTLESHRAMQYMVENKYLDPTAQKAYLEGINGCVEHVVVVQEVIQHAKHNKEDVNITWFDLEDAFGSVPHVLIPYVMSYYHIPEKIITYVTSLYSKLTGKVFTRSWESELFHFLRGVFQGDPYSGIIFLIIFNPIIENIKKHKQEHGYRITIQDKPATCVVTTPFADDFNIITRNSTHHQNIVTDVEKKISTMGLIVKPRRCRSIVNAQMKKISFHLVDKEGSKVQIDSVID